VLIAACVCPDMQHTCVNKKIFDLREDDNAGQDIIWSYIVVRRLLSRLDLDLKSNFDCDQAEFDF
jgi:hypothetical protein